MYSDAQLQAQHIQYFYYDVNIHILEKTSGSSPVSCIVIIKAYHPPPYPCLPPMLDQLLNTYECGATKMIFIAAYISNSL